MPFCRKCGEEISDSQHENFNGMCPKCVMLENVSLVQQTKKIELEKKKLKLEKKKTRLKDRRFLMILGIVLLGITGLGTAIVMSIHYWWIVEYINPDLNFGRFFIENLLVDVIIGFFVGIVLVVIIVIVCAMAD